MATAESIVYTLRIELIKVMITVAEDTGPLSTIWAFWFLTLLAVTSEPAELGDS